jgi:glucose dehydrogenase
MKQPSDRSVSELLQSCDRQDPLGYDPGIWKGGMPSNNGFVHHGLWGYDLPAAPNLINLHVNGKLVKVVAQVSKQGFCYVFYRVTGKPIRSIEEKPRSAIDDAGGKIFAKPQDAGSIMAKPERCS